MHKLKVRFHLSIWVNARRKVRPRKTWKRTAQEEALKVVNLKPSVDRQGWKGFIDTLCSNETDRNE